MAFLEISSGMFGIKIVLNNDLAVLADFSVVEF